jgi:hypothetical protein
MAGFDTRNALNLAIRHLTKTALERNAGGWIPPKEEERQRKDQERQHISHQRDAERQQKDQARQEQAQQKQFIADEKEREKNLSAFQKGNHPEVPPVVYHGSQKNFSEFTGQPNWFADDPYVAEGYSGRKGSIYPAHVSVKNPIHIKDFDMNDDASAAFPLAQKLGIPPAHLEVMGYKHAFEVVNSFPFVEAAIKNGHDGIIVNEGKNKTIGAFFPNQIKSATGNQGTFDPSNPDIRKSEGGAILSKQFPTHYMPDVGRQVMNTGGVPDESLTGYHGSGEQFEAFDPNRAGSTTGSEYGDAAAYVSTEEPLAKEYRDRAARKKGILFRGKPLREVESEGSGIDSARAELADRIRDGFEPHEAIENRAKHWLYFANHHKEMAEKEPENREEHLKDAKAFEDRALLFLALDPQEFERPKGHMYQVKVLAHPDHFLDWNKPFSEQSDHVREALTPTVEKIDELYNNPKRRRGEMISKYDQPQNLSGEKIYRYIQKHSNGDWSKPSDPLKSDTGNHKYSTKYLKDKGVRGVTYLDSLWNAAKPPRNYAVYKPEDLEIMKRYARGGSIHVNNVSRPKFALGGTNGTEKTITPGFGETSAEAGEIPFAGRVGRGSGDVSASDQTSAEEALEGLPSKVKIPKTGETLMAGPDPRIRQIARNYMAETGMPYNPPKKYAKVDPKRAERIAQAFEEMPHDPENPVVKSSYDALIKETMAQYQAAKKAGFKAEFWNPESDEDPYDASPRLAVEDIRKNHHMYVFPTRFGYGSGEPITEEEIRQNPMLQDSGESWNGQPVTVNDIFRAIHDYYGHAKEGVGFRHDGEENAWRAHASMFSPLARLAMTTETRGQNSWLNFGPHGDKNQKARTEDTVFADQKIGVLPPWAVHEGAEDFMQPEDVEVMKNIYNKHYPEKAMARGGFVRDHLQDGGTPEDLNKVGLYSKAARVASALPQKKAKGDQMIAALRDPKRGVKKEELINAGLMTPDEKVHPDWAGRSVTTDELADHLRGQMPQVEETQLGGKQPYDAKRLEQLQNEHASLSQHPIDDPSFGEEKYDEMIRLMNIRDQSSTDSLYRAAEEAMKNGQKAQSRGDRATAEKYFREYELLNVRAEKLDLQGQGLEKPTKYSQYTLPGGENYREVLLKLPHEKKQRVGVLSNGTIMSEEELSNPIARKTAEKIGLTMEDRMMPTMAPFKSPHWDDPNVLAHIRMADRTGPNGEKILHVEELQSDWGQKGKKYGFSNSDAKEKLNNLNAQWDSLGAERRAAEKEMAELPDYNDRFEQLRNRVLEIGKERDALSIQMDQLRPASKINIPSAPYVTSTEGWTDIALKRVLKEAAEGGYDKIVWTPGDEQAKRYDLSKQVKEIVYNPNTKYFAARGHDNEMVHSGQIDPKELPDHIGKEAAQKLLDQEPNNAGIHILHGDDLKIGGEGMKGYYDKIVPSRLQALAKKHDPQAKMGMFNIAGPRENIGGMPSQYPSQIQAQSLDVTPQMRESIMKGQEAYKEGGYVEGYADGGAVENRDHLGFGGVGEGPVAGSTGSAGGNSYGGGSSGDSGGVSMSSGNGRDNSMAAARAADRASVAGYSASPTSAGGGFGGGDGRDYADPRNRAYSEQMAKSARQSYLDANYPESPRLGDLAQPNPAATLKQPNRPSTPTPPSAYGQAAPQPSFPHTPTPFSGYPRDVQNALNPTRPDSSFGGTAIDPTGAQTADVLKNLGTATDAVTMLNAPGFWGGVTRFVAGTPSQPTPQQESQMAKIFSPDMPIARIGDPSLGARAGSIGSMPSGTTSYGSDLTPSGSSVSRPVTPTPSTAYGGNSSQDSSNRGLGSFAGSLGSQGPAQQNAAPRQDFNSAFAAARSGGNKTFNWTNPRTGKTGTYGTQLARKEGGRVPSMSEPDEWLIDENETEKKPVKKANKQVSKPERSPIVSRALMVSSRKS